jgi:hypothetical protein
MRALVHNNPDALILSFAESYRASVAKPTQKRGDFQYRAMLAGRVQKLIYATYKVEANRDAVWEEWLSLAGIPKGHWLRSDYGKRGGL